MIVNEKASTKHEQDIVTFSTGRRVANPCKFPFGCVNPLPLVAKHREKISG
jgi:hypothetical protein